LRGQKIRLLTGGIASDSVNVLALVRKVGPPTLTIVRASDGQEMTAPFRRIASDRAVLDELDRYHIRVYKATVEGLAPDRSYRARAASEGIEAVAPFRTPPTSMPAEGFSFVASSCYYDYRFHQQENYRNTILDAKRGHWFGTSPLFALLMGDNLYLDVVPRQREYKLDGVFETVKEYRRYLVKSRYAFALGEVPLFTTWDDHEFWNNYPERQFHLSRTKRRRREYMDAGKACLDLFQASLNPAPICPGTRSYRFEAPGVSFFVADTRSERTPFDKGRGRMFSAAELAEIVRWCRELDRPGVLVLGQPLWMMEGGKSDYNPPDFRHEYATIWKAIVDAPWDVLVMSGDVHFSRLVSIRTPGQRIVHELVSSPACHIPTVFTIALGSYRDQDQGEVHAPLARKVRGKTYQLDRYYFGTDSQNSIAQVHMRPARGGAVSVSCAFVDIAARRRPAAGAVDLELTGDTAGGGRARGTWFPRRPVCRGRDLFQLKARR
jgi:hypothetical protein